MKYQPSLLARTISAVLFSGIFLPAQSADLPVNGQVQSGTASISTSANQMNIQQSTPKVSIDWDSFDVGKEHSVQFQQPNSDSVAFNRVTGGNASQIQGRLSANGKVFLANPNGVIFSKDAQINVGSLLATSKELASGQDINSKNLKFVRKAEQEGEINNQAHIVVNSKNGFVVLVGDKVKNTGTIEAKPFEKTETKEKWICSGGEDWMCDDEWTADIYGVSWQKITDTIKTQSQGQVILATGDGFTLNLEDSYIDVKVDPNTMAGLVKNEGIIIADDGRIELTAAGKDQALKAVVNNNGLLQANQIKMNKSGTISLVADKVELDTNADIKSDNQLLIKSPSQSLQLSAKKGAKITVKDTEISADKLNISGQFGRENSTQFLNDEHKTQSNSFTVKTKGKLSVNEQEQGENSHIQNSALASMLETSGQVNLNTDLPELGDHQFHYELTGVDFSGKLAVNSFKNADSLLLINSPSYVKFQNADIQANNGRLSIGTALWNFRPHTKPDNIDASFNVQNSRFNLNNGSFGVARDLSSRFRVWFDENAKSAEEDQRSFYDFNLSNTQLEKVDDFFVGGGFGKVNIDGLQHTGRMNTYINAGNSRNDKNPERYEYGLRDLKERLTRSQLDHSNRRWNFNSKVGNLDLQTLVNFEVSQFFDGWFAGKYQQDKPLETQYIRHHLDTEINIKNSNINSHNGFIHLMAKKINLTNSDLNVSFDKVLNYTEGNLNKIGINAENTVLDNSHLRIEGADLKGASPNEGFASLYLIGDVLGKNKSSLWVKSHQGYTMQTNGDVTLKGEKTPDDLKITVINTGAYAEADQGFGADNHNADDYLSSRGFVAGNTPRKKTVLDNAYMEVLAPNGSEAYKTENDLPFEVKDNATFNYFEKPRIRGLDLAKIEGKGGNKLTERQYLQALDRAYGIQASNLSSQQSQQISDNKLALKEPTQKDFTLEKLVSLSVCDEKGECYEESLGNQHSNAKVSVGQIK